LAVTFCRLSCLTSDRRGREHCFLLRTARLSLCQDFDHGLAPFLRCEQRGLSSGRTIERKASCRRDSLERPGASPALSDRRCSAQHLRGQFHHSPGSGRRSRPSFCMALRAAVNDPKVGPIIALFRPFRPADALEAAAVCRAAGSCCLPLPPRRRANRFNRRGKAVANPHPRFRFSRRSR